MENATKALIIAGAVLISILLISVGIMVFNSAADPISQAQSSSEQQAVQMFNESFTSYLGTGVTGQQARGVVSAVIASNAKNQDHQVTIGGKNATEFKISSINNRTRYDVVETIDETGYIKDITITAKGSGTGTGTGTGSGTGTGGTVTP